MNGPSIDTGSSNSRVLKGRRAVRSIDAVRHPFRWIVLVGLALYFIAPWLNALKLENHSAYPGWTLLFFGWIGVLGGEKSTVGWLANPLFMCGTLMALFDSRRVAAALMASSAACSLGSFLLKEVLTNEGGTTATVIGYDQGFWIWMAAIWFNFFTTLALLCLTRPNSVSSATVEATEIPPDAFQ